MFRAFGGLRHPQSHMGIRGLLGFLKDHGLINSATEPMWPPGSVLAVDVPIFAHKFAYMERTIPGIQKRMIAFGHELRTLHAEPIFVFDGAKLHLKAGERQARAAARDRGLDRLRTKASKDLEALLQGYEGPEGIVIKADAPWSTTTGILVSGPQAAGAPLSEGSESTHDDVAPDTASVATVINTFFQGMLFPTQKDYRELQEALASAGFRVAQAKYEAEALCAHLTRIGEAYAVLTEDSDAVAFGALRTILKFTTEPKVVVFDDVLAGLSMSREQFVDLCCLFGCDFCTNIYMVGPRMAFQSMQRYGSWAAFRDDLLKTPQVVMYGRANDLSRTLADVQKFDALYAQVSQCFLTCAEESL